MVLPIEKIDVGKQVTSIESRAFYGQEETSKTRTGTSATGKCMTSVIKEELCRQDGSASHMGRQDIEPAHF